MLLIFNQSDLWVKTEHKKLEEVTMLDINHFSEEERRAAAIVFVQDDMYRILKSRYIFPQDYTEVYKMTELPNFLQYIAQSGKEGKLHWNELHLA